MKEIIIHVRELYEYNAEKVENSICIPMSMMESGWWKEKFESYSKPWTKIVIMCHSGARAWVIKNFLQHSCKWELEVYEWWLISWVANGNKTI